MHHCRTGSLHCWPRLCADSSQDSGAISRAFLYRQGLDGLSIDIGLNLPPECRPRSASTEPDGFAWDTDLLKNCKRISQAESYALQNSAYDVGPGVRGGQANQHSASVRIEIRGSFAHQIRRPQKAIGANANLCCLCREVVIGISVAVDNAKLITEPAQRKSRSLRHSHNQPAIRKTVAKRVYASFGIERRKVSGGKHNSRSSNGCAYRSRRNHSRTDCAGSLISRTGHDWSSCKQTGCSRASF